MLWIPFGSVFLHVNEEVAIFVTVLNHQLVALQLNGQLNILYVKKRANFRTLKHVNINRKPEAIQDEQAIDLFL